MTPGEGRGLRPAPPKTIARADAGDKHGLLMPAMRKAQARWHDVCLSAKKKAPPKTDGAKGRNLSRGGLRGRRNRRPPEWVRVEGGGTTGPVVVRSNEGGGRLRCIDKANIGSPTRFCNHATGMAAMHSLHRSPRGFRRKPLPAFVLIGRNQIEKGARLFLLHLIFAAQRMCN